MHARRRLIAALALLLPVAPALAQDAATPDPLRTGPLEQELIDARTLMLMAQRRLQDAQLLEGTEIDPVIQEAQAEAERAIERIGRAMEQLDAVQ